MINWKTRFKNPQFWVPFMLFLFSTIGSVAHVTEADVTTWNGVVQIVKNIVMNPAQLFALVFALYGHIVDPTTKGFSDSQQALSYKKPKDWREKQ